MEWTLGRPLCRYDAICVVILCGMRGEAGLVRRLTLNSPTCSGRRTTAVRLNIKTLSKALAPSGVGGVPTLAVKEAQPMHCEQLPLRPPLAD